MTGHEEQFIWVADTASGALVDIAVLTDLLRQFGEETILEAIISIAERVTGAAAVALLSLDPAAMVARLEASSAVQVDRCDLSSSWTTPILWRVVSESAPGGLWWSARPRCLVPPPNDTHPPPLRAIAFLPLFNSRQNTTRQTPEALLVLYLNSPEEIRDCMRMVRLQDVIAAALLSHHRAQATNLRLRLEDSLGFISSLNEFCELSLDILSKELEFESASIWLLQPRRRVFQRMAQLPHHQRSFFLDTIRVAAVKESQLGPSGSLDATEFLSREDVPITPPTGEDSDGQRFVLLPLELPSDSILGHDRHRVVGFVLLGNKFMCLGNERREAPVMPQDISRATDAARIITVLAFQMILSQSHEADYERRIHGIKTNLLSVRDTLAQLDERGHVSDLVDPRLREHLPNSIEWVKEIERQIGRTGYQARAKLVAVRMQPTPVLVLLRLGIRAAEVAARASRIGSFSVHQFCPGRSHAARLTDTSVVCDPRAMLEVLRNIFENSLYYRHRNAELRVWIWVEAAHGMIVIHVQDNGIGIPSQEREYVFEEGFRGQTAERMHFLGDGSGLHECRVLLEAMGGSVRAEDPVGGESGAHITVTLRRGPSEERG